MSEERTVEERVTDLEIGLVELVEALQEPEESAGSALERMHQRFKAKVRKG